MNTKNKRIVIAAIFVVWLTLAGPEYRQAAKQSGDFLGDVKADNEDYGGKDEMSADVFEKPAQCLTLRPYREGEF